MKEVIVTEGTHIEYETNSKSIIFGDDDLSINLKNRERDEKCMIDICSDEFGALYASAQGGVTRYVAQVEIPPREYTEQESEDEEGGTVLVPVEFDIEKCTVYLWSID